MPKPRQRSRRTAARAQATGHDAQAERRAANPADADPRRALSTDFHAADRQASEHVIKGFYEEFRAERAAFLESIRGIPQAADREWYASLMLNRLMFLYFIQQKNFLDDDAAYLRHRLDTYRPAGDAHRPAGDAYRPAGEHAPAGSFYRDFLLPLFHEALARQERTPRVEALTGRVPYLGGGLFDQHPLERSHAEIHIGDRAFARLFDFFDKYRWRADELAASQERTVTPDVLGYIFEKYVNQKQMGAYFTREDVTDYISKTAIIPFLFETAAKTYPPLLHPQAPAWSLLRNHPERYIYQPVRKGILEEGRLVPLPQEIAAGINDPRLRTLWNRPAPAAFALAGETWREHVARRTRCLELREKLTAGEVSSVNHLITYNLDIRRFAADLLQTCEEPELLRAFYRALERITILDPTCGSGALLFAAMKILAPLHEACLRRMEAFPQDEDFRLLLRRVEPHARPYMILRSIIVNNLYGVDVMEEATEICKLRLFLKLVAHARRDASAPNQGIEPLPDIDFNIRTGNTLVGFASYGEVRQVISGATERRPDLGSDIGRIAESAFDAARAFEKFHGVQAREPSDASQSRSSKSELRERLKALDEELDRYLAGEYGGRAGDTSAFAGWRESHRPFHWFVEFYDIIKRGGFDVIIGNPPYVEYSKVRAHYELPAKGYETQTTGNLYPLVVERSLALLAEGGSLSVILPLSAFCTQRMRPLIELVKRRSGAKWVAHFGWRPATLFEGVNIPLSILISKPGAHATHTTTFVKWYKEQRPALFSNLQFAPSDEFLLFEHVIPKIGAPIERRILAKMFSKRKSIGDYLSHTKGQGARLFYRNTGGLYWRIFTDFRPFFSQDGSEMSSSTESTLDFPDRETLSHMTGILNSNLYWLFYVVFSSFHHVNPPDILAFPVDLEEMDEATKRRLRLAARRVMDDLKRHSQIRQRVHRGGHTSRMQTFFPSRSKPLVDELDRVLALHYGFDAEELDFIINYDIKYRLADDEAERCPLEHLPARQLLTASVAG